MAKLLQVADSLEMNELHRAVQENRLEAVKFLVKNGADVTYPIERDQTPLHIAVKNNYQEITEVLCKSKTRMQVQGMIYRQTSDTDTALQLAAKKNSFESARFLLSYGANFDTRDKELRKIQDLTTDENIKELLKSIADVFALTEKKDNQALFEKFNSCPVENLPAVMYARKNQSYNSHQDPFRVTSITRACTVLQTAMDKDNLEQIEIIINFRIKKLKQKDWQAGAKIDKLVLHSKAARRHFNNFKYRRTEKEAANVLHSSFAFLEAYKEQGDPALDNQPLLIVIEEVLEHFENWKGSQVMERSVGARLNFSSDHAEQMLNLCVMAPMLLFMKMVYTSELIEAAKQNNLGKVEMCLTGHPDLNKTDDASGFAALHYAIRNEQIAKLLLNFGADPTIASRNTDKVTPLQMALREPEGNSRSKIHQVSSDVVLLMFENTSDDKLTRYVNMRTDRDRSTPLHFAVKKKNQRLVEFLLKKGGVYCSRDASDGMPSSYLYTHNNEMISKLLKCTERSFTQAREGKVEELIEALRGFDVNTLLAVGGARDEENYTLDQVLDLERHSDEADVVRKMLADAKGSK